MNMRKLKKVFFIILLLLVPITYAEARTYDCHTLEWIKGLCLSVVFKSERDKGEDFTKFSYPHDLRRGEEFWLYRLTAYNKGDDPTPQVEYALDIQPLGGQIPEYPADYGKWRFVVPPLQVGDTYEIIFDKSTGHVGYLNGQQQYPTVIAWNIYLYKLGEWVVKETLTPSIGFTSIIHGGWKNNVFVVKETTLVSLQKTVIDNVRDLLMIVLAVVAIYVSIHIARNQSKKERERQEEIQTDLLKSIETRLRTIHQSVNGHKKELSKNPPTIPSYFLVPLDANFYLTNLRFKIRGHETENLKEWLIHVSEKITNINRLIELAQDLSSVQSLGTDKNPHVKEIKDQNYKYYKDLEHLISQLRRELIKIQYETSPEFKQKKLGAKARL